jgi:hypothetical protein
MKFVTIGNALVPSPLDVYREGQAAPRIGMQWTGSGYVSTGRALSVEPGSRECNMLARMARRGDVAAADPETAIACGVDYIALEWSGPDSGWLPKD